MSLPAVIVRFWRQEPSRRALLAEALLALVAASAAIRLLPFSKAVGLGARPLPQRKPPPEAVVRDTVVCVEAAARRLPWKTLCFQKGLALQWILRRRGIDARLHYGVGQDEEGELAAHVWIAADGDIVIGGEQAPRFRSLIVLP